MKYYNVDKIRLVLIYNIFFCVVLCNANTSITPRGVLVLTGLYLQTVIRREQLRLGRSGPDYETLSVEFDDDDDALKNRKEK